MQSVTSASASVASGVLDSISAGILLYTATVELSTFPRSPPTSQAHLYRASGARVHLQQALPHVLRTKLWFSVISFALGAGIMALLVRFESVHPEELSDAFLAGIVG